MTTWTPTAADRDESGKIKLTQDTPRSLADLLPPSVAAVAAPARPAAPAVSGRVQLAVAISAGLLLVFALSYLIGMRSPAAPAATPPSPAPSPVASPAAPTAAPQVAAVVAFAAPGGDVLGPISAAQAYHFTGRYGDGWLQSDVPGSGRVWIRRADLLLDPSDLAAVARLPDLAPPPTAVPPPPPTPVPIPPTQCAIVGVGSATASACGTADLDTLEETAKAQLITDQHLRNVTLSTATPYGGEDATSP